MRYMVTGAAGFIGQHLCLKLINRGHLVLPIDRVLGRRVDTTRIIKVAKKFAKVYPMDGIFHLAAVSRTPPAIADPTVCAMTNVMGTVYVLEAARQAKARRIIIASSNVVYAMDNPYKASKLCAELWAQTYRSLYGQSNLCLRFSNVYGPKMAEDDIAVFPSMLRSKKKNGYIEVSGDGKQTRQFTHVSDIVEAMCLAMDSNYCGDPIDLCTGINTDMNRVVELMGSVPQYTEPRFGDTLHLPQDPSRAKEILGWQAKIPLEVGIKDMVHLEPRFHVHNYARP